LPLEFEENNDLKLWDKTDVAVSLLGPKRPLRICWNRF